MAEIIGLAAATISIGKTIQTVARLCRQLQRASKNRSKVGKQIQGFSTIFKGFTNSVKLAVGTLEMCLDENLDTPVVQSIIDMGYIKGITEESDFLEGLVEDVWREVPGIQSRFPVLTSFNWTRLKPDIEALIPPITNFQTELDLTITTINCARVTALLKQSPSVKLERQVQFLQNVIESQMETIQFLQEEIKYIPPVSGPNTADSSHRRPNSQIRLCHLAQSIAESGTVPSTPVEDFRFKKMKRKRHSRLFSDGSSRSRTPTHEAQRPRTDQPANNRSEIRPLQGRPMSYPNSSHRTIPRQPVAGGPRLEEVRDVRTSRRPVDGFLPGGGFRDRAARGSESDLELNWHAEERTTPAVSERVSERELGDQVTGPTPSTSTLAPAPLSPDKTQPVEIVEQEVRPQEIRRPTENPKLPSPTATSGPSTPSVASSRQIKEEEPTRPRLRRQARHSVPPSRAATPGPSTATEVQRVEIQHEEPPGERVKRPSSMTNMEDPSSIGTWIVGWVRTETGRQKVEAFVNRQETHSFISEDLVRELGLKVEKQTRVTGGIGRYNGSLKQSVGMVTLYWGESEVKYECYVLKKLEKLLVFGRMFVPLEEERGRWTGKRGLGGE